MTGKRSFLATKLLKCDWNLATFGEWLPTETRFTGKCILPEVKIAGLL